MYTGKTVFAQLLEHLPLHQFRLCVKRYNGNHKLQSFSCFDQYLCLFFALQETVYALDSTTIDLCLALFPWAKFRTHKGAVKMHTLLDLRGNIPSFVAITDGKVHDVNILDVLIIEPGSFYIMDRGNIDFERLYHIHQAQGFFVIRAKSNLSFKRRYSHPVDKSTGVRCDRP